MPSKVTTPVIIRLENELILALDALAKEQGSSRSSAARAALAAGLEALKKPQQQKSARGRKKAPAKGSEPESAPGAPFDLVLFAAQVMEAAKRAETGKFGEDRIFINHAWRQFEQDAEPEGMDLRLFKQRLAEANNQRYLSLVCADMAPMLEQKDVKESETRWLSATFHLLCL